MLNSIVLCGGITRIPNLHVRFMNELRLQLPSSMNINMLKCASPDHGSVLTVDANACSAQQLFAISLQGSVHSAPMQVCLLPCVQFLMPVVPMGVAHLQSSLSTAPRFLLLLLIYLLLNVCRIPEYMPERSTQYAGYAGGAIVAKSLNANHTMTKEDYDERGPAYINKKC
jgi:actin-related protein